MNRLFIFLLIFCFSFTSFAQDSYSVSSIPKELLKNANVVKRMEDMRFEVINTGETRYYQKYALTILNENGSRYANFYQGYDKLISIQSIEGALYDFQGKQLRKLKNKDLQDISAVSNISLFEDNRAKVHNFYYAVYPYTVEYEVEVKYNHTLYMPNWNPTEYENIAVQYSRFTVVFPGNYNIRYKAFNYKEAPKTDILKDKKSWQWETKNLSAIQKTFASPVWDELTISVYIAPSEFEVEGYKGNMNTWENFGKFQLAMNKDRDKLPDNISSKVQQLITGISDESEKVKVLYKFLQQNTRYISIQLGIGGWQPFEASYVAKNGYGDCKALSNYMYSLLKVAGIKSYYTLVNAGESREARKMMDDFPSRQSNHIILCVPLKNDTMWLECTSQTLPAGYMSAFTANRKALLITEEGGKIVSTPKYGLQENQQIRSIKGMINNKDGSIDVSVNTRYTGIQQDHIHDMLTALSKDKVQKQLNEHLDLSTYDIKDFKYKETLQNVPVVNEELDIYLSDYATMSGKRLFMSPNFLNRSSLRVPDEKRTYDFVFDLEYKDVDSVEIAIPEGYKPEALPQDVVLITKYGKYTSTVKLVNNQLFYLRTMEQYSGRYPASEQKEIAAFFETIYKTDRSKAVFVKAE
jgi:hypothetical protein